MTGRLVIVGASLAGLRAAEAARKEGFAGQITMIGAEEHLPYDRLPLSKTFLDPGTGAAATKFRSEAALAELQIDLRLGQRATALDTVAREVIADGRPVGYDALVIATGSAARPLPGAGHLAGVHTLRTLDDAQAIRTALAHATNVVVAGAGFIGSEIASSARKRGLRVTLIEAQLTPLASAVGKELGAACAALHLAAGTELRCGEAITAFAGQDQVTGVQLADGTILPADLVIAGIGAEPVTGWLEGSGLTIDNGVVCDAALWTGAPGVYAAGDVCRWYNQQFSQTMRVEHWSNANAQGAMAARNALNPAAAKPYSAVPFFFSDWYGNRIQFAGLPGADGLEILGDTSSGRFAALYRAGDELSGVLGLNAQPEFAKLRALVAKRTSWTDAAELARSHSLNRKEQP